MEKCLFNALSKSIDIETMDDAFILGFIDCAKEFLPKYKLVLQKTYEFYKAYWMEKLPYLEKMKKEIEDYWRIHEDAVSSRIEEVTRIPWKIESFLIQLVDALSYGGLVLGECLRGNQFAIGFCEPKVFLHVLTHELIHSNTFDDIHKIGFEFNLTDDQTDAINEAFARLIEREVSKSITPEAEEPLESTRKEVEIMGFLEFFDAVLNDWPNYITRIERYVNISYFISEEVKRRKEELDRAKLKPLSIPHD